MAEWSDWYAKEDPTTWVLAEVLKRRATETPDREYLKFADNPWVSYGEVNARSNRVANALIARGVQPGESVSVMLPNCEEFLPVWFGILKAGAVMSSINTAYKGDFLSWTINLVESKKLFISDVFLDRLDLVKGELPLLEHVIVMKTGAQEGPDPSLKWEPLEALLEEGSDGEPDGVELLVDRRRPDHVHLGHHRPLQGRHQAERGRLLLGPRPARGGLGDGRQVGRVAGRGHLLQLPAALPLQRPGALGLPGAGRRRPGRLRGALLLEHASGSRSRTPRRRSSTRSARSATSSGTSRPRSWTGPTRSTPASPPRRPRTSTTSSRSASGSSSSRATASPRPAWRPTWTRPSRASRARWARPTRATRSRSWSRAPTGRCRPTRRARSWST